MNSDELRWFKLGLLKAVGSDGITDYNPMHCPLNQTKCNSDCVLFKNGQCKYVTSFDKRDLYCDIDNKILFSSHQKDGIGSCGEKSGEKGIPSTPSPSPNQNLEVKKYEEIKKFLEKK